MFLFLLMVKDIGYTVTSVYIKGVQYTAHSPHAAHQVLLCSLRTYL